MLNINGRYFKLYVTSDLLDSYMKVQKLSNALNISFIRLLLSGNYDGHSELNDVRLRVDKSIQREIIFNRINDRLRDSLIFDKCAESTLKLFQRGSSKKLVLQHFKDELELLELSDLDNRTKQIMRKKIKEQLSNFRKVSNKVITREQMIKEKFAKIKEFENETIQNNKTW